MYHLEKTLPHNLQAVPENSRFEYVLLNYNSQDEMDDYVMTNFKKEMKSGKLRYLKEESVEHFSPPHSRNVSFLGSTGDVVCNVDVDNYINEDFCEYLYWEFKNREYPTIVHAMNTPNQNGWGRLAMTKKDFIEIGGYSEYMQGYGGEDVDLFDRARDQQWNLVRMPECYVNNIISHSNEARIENMNPVLFEKNANLKIGHQLHHTNLLNLKTAKKYRMKGKFNKNKWGQASLLVNFENRITVGAKLSI